MFDGMRYVPVLLRGEVALLKEVPEDDVASSTCTERYGKRGPGASFDGGSRTSRGTRETGRRASDASAISEEESESDDEGESVHVSQDGLGPAETEAERRERLHAEFFAEIAAAASRRALRRLLYKSTRDRHSISKSKQLGLCTVGPGGIVLELAMLNAAYRAAKESEIPNFKGSYLGRFPLVLADFWTIDHLSERSRSVGAFSGTRARGTLKLKRR